jgi:sulfide:quinone oxidoreductase
LFNLSDRRAAAKLSVPATSGGEALGDIFAAKGIQHQRGFTLSHVDPDSKIAYSAEGDSQNFDILMATPPIRAVEAVRDTGLSEVQNGEGWLPTDHQTLGVYVKGVCDRRYR